VSTETITITAYGRNFSPRTFVADALAYAQRETRDTIGIYASSYGSWDLLKRKRPRMLTSLELPDGIAEDILGDIHEFLASPEKYRKLGIPHRRGFLFYGVPGSGKTSLAEAVAGELKADLYVIGLSNKAAVSDERLMRLLATVRPGAVVLFEDIDCAFEARGNDKPGDTPKEEGLTFSGLLNALDGVAAATGIIFIMTTNHIDKLDPALIRPGRTDRRIEFGYATLDQIVRTRARFGLNGHPAMDGGKHTMAEVQELCLRARYETNGKHDVVSP
jgi:chaperone BCS1